MARTWKDRPRRLRFPDRYTYRIPGWWEIVWVGPKLPRRQDVEDNWMLVSPRWHKRQFGYAPERTEFRTWAAALTRASLDTADPPPLRHLPYYW